MAFPVHDTRPREVLLRLSAELQRRSKELDALIDMLPLGIAIADDPECRWIRANRALAAHLRIDVSQNASLPDRVDEWPFQVLKDGQALSPDQLPMRDAARRAVEVPQVDIDFVHPDGSRVTLSEWAAPLFDEGGTVTGAIGVFVDVTERRRIEQSQRFLVEASRALSSSLDYDATLSSLARLAVPALGDYCVIDVAQYDGTFARVEFAVADPELRWIAERLKRYPPSLAGDSPVSQVIHTGEPLLVRDCPREMLERSAQDAEHLTLLERFGVCSFMMAPLRARGRTLGLLTLGCCSTRCRYDERDLQFTSELASRAGLALDNALLYRDAQDANRAKEDFLATLSHELRTPLNALVGWTHILKTRTLDEGTRRRAIESIERNANAQVVLINDLLDVSRVTSGKLRLATALIDPGAVVLAAVEGVRPAVRAREIDLLVSVPSLEGRVMGDADRLQQVIWNLLSNAVKFTPVRGQVRVSVEQTGGAVQITVADNGLGIDPTFLPYVFDRFSQGDSSSTRTHGGLGLGLAIVRHLVDLHGGTVSVSSDGAGRGSTFVVILPLTGGVSDMPEAAVRASTELRPLAGLRVLAVDDDPDSRELILMSVQGAGGEVMAVESAMAALVGVSTFHPDVVVADLAMPDMDGFVLLQEMGRMPGGAPPAIALSAYAAADDVRRARDAGFRAHLEKPADYGRLIREIAALARRGDSRATLT